jgi:hypothetical protein
VDLGLRPSRRGTGTVSGQHAVRLPGYVALETADDLSFALALLCASRDVLLGAGISAHPGQADHVQGAVGFPVATSVETVSDDLTGGCLDGGDPTQTGEGGLAPQPLRVVFKATTKRVAALSVPMPGKETNSGATCPTSRSRCASNSSISSERVPRNGGPPNAARTWWPWARQ